jgi:hypothetical protein
MRRSHHEAPGLEFQSASARSPNGATPDERSGGGLMQIEQCLSDGVRLRFVAFATAILLPVVVVAQGADELASTIEQSFDSIEFRIDLRPEQAASDLEAQGRQLELLEQQAPEHPALPELKQKFSQLQDDLAAALTAAASDAAAGGGETQVPSAPAAFTTGMEQVDQLHRQAEAEFLRGETEQAADYLQQAETKMVDLERRYGDDLPQGHVPLLVAKEKIAALKDQLATQ